MRPDRLRHELLRPAVQGGVSCALVGGAVAAFGMLRPVCACAGIEPTALDDTTASMEAEDNGTRRASAWSVVEHQADEWLAGTVLDALSARARRWATADDCGACAVECAGTIAALRDRGARLQGRFQLYAQENPRARTPLEKSFDFSR